ncbi:MAG: FAD-dependent thymidylate synthase [Deltaproteobacteria bacterium]|nr:FAD-dependent thymidylate synthase [Deltaproteobacteria bacterium]MBI4373462.1 FAD-dependent thymidylate synthase [Deltaproteobacteria bacterium]
MPQTFLSDRPVVTLAGVIEEPYNLAIAAARTCYSSKGILTTQDVVKDDAAIALRDRIAKSTLEAGHLTTRQHASFVFALDKISRHFIWSFLHSHPFYNSEQVSQRYVKVAPGHFTVPPLAEGPARRYLEIVNEQMETYNRLIELLLPDIRRRFFRIFPAREKSEKSYEAKLKKRAYEVARYVLPVATHSFMYHTVNALTLLRYYRLCNLFDTSLEQRYVVQKMVDAVCEADPDFKKEIKDPIPLEETPEFRFFSGKFVSFDPKRNKEFIREFDRSLEGHDSKLVDYKSNAEAVLAQAAREVLGLSRERLVDDEAIDLVMNPAKNSYFGDTLNLTTLSKLARTMVHPHYTFQKKISHTADSQDQRHRMTPASRPILMAHYTGEPDYISPMLVRENDGPRQVYEEAMRKIFHGINDLLSDGVSPEFALYLLPNAFSIRFQESGDLLNLHHKWRTRACYDSQEEIFFATIDELKQVGKIHPRIARHILAPCYLRKGAGIKPYCPEGDRYCGLPVWKYGIEGYQRAL